MGCHFRTYITLVRTYFISYQNLAAVFLLIAGVITATKLNMCNFHTHRGGAHFSLSQSQQLTHYRGQVSSFFLSPFNLSPFFQIFFHQSLPFPFFFSSPTTPS